MFSALHPANRPTSITLLVMVWTMLALTRGVDAGAGVVVDDLSDPARWSISTSEGVSLRTSIETLPGGQRVLRADYDFAGGAGFGVMRLARAMPLPENFRFTFGLRGHGRANNLEFKLLDASGQNVWWVNTRDLHWPEQRREMVLKRRHFSFAWGPDGPGAGLKCFEAIEIAVAAGQGGKGTIWIDDLRLEELPPITPYTGTPTASATSSAPGCEPGSVLDEREETRWQPNDSDPRPALTIDLGQVRTLGGVVIEWDKPAACVAVEHSVDGRAWTVERVLSGVRAPWSVVRTPDAEARYVRLRVPDPTNANDPALALMQDLAVRNHELRMEHWQRGGEEGRPAMRRVGVLSDEALPDENAAWYEMARHAPRGRLPRVYTDRTQCFWTVMGVPDDDAEALIDEDGRIEVGKQAWSIEPMILDAQRTLTWADGSHTQSLRSGWMPMPSVRRSHQALDLDIEAMVDGAPGQSVLRVRYTLTNTGEQPAHGWLALLVRPFQVNPPWQFLNTPGGSAAIEKLGMGAKSRELRVDDRVMVLSDEPAWAACTTADTGEAGVMIDTPSSQGFALCPRHGASGTLALEYDLAPGASRSWVIAVPMHPSRHAPQPTPTNDDFTARARALAQQWRAWVERVPFSLPPSARWFEDSVKANLAYVLINADGPGFQPGSRSYERSWIRDGSMTGIALAQFGMVDRLEAFLKWYAPFQFPSGKVPCVVDSRGADPVSEHDSHGQFIHAISECAAYLPKARREAFIDDMIGPARKAGEYIGTLTAQRRTAEFTDEHATRQEPGKPPVPVRAFYGLMPESISHEGYSSKPMHSYWDQFFACRGLGDLAVMELLKLGRDHAVGLINPQLPLYDLMSSNLLVSLRLTRAAHGIRYIPGCVELGDFDATSTAAAITVCGANDQSGLHSLEIPRPWWDATFDKYWAWFEQRRDDPGYQWIDYTPYELRVVGAMVMLGHRERALAMLEWFRQDQLPQAWHHWAEIVHRDRRAGQWIGDMPHTWVGSDFIRSVRTMLVYEEGDRLHLLAGVPAAWLGEPGGVSFELPTRFGTIGVQAHREGEIYRVRISGDVPASRVQVHSPLDKPASIVLVNGAAASIDEHGTVRLDTLPATVEFTP